MTDRDWTHARAKIDDERCCRVCQTREYVEAAHTIARRFDPDGATYIRNGRRRTQKVVRAIDVVPLCTTHHIAYDRHELDLLPYLTIEEQAAAVSHVGIVSAMRRLTGTH